MRDMRVSSRDQAWIVCVYVSVIFILLSSKQLLVHVYVCMLTPRDDSNYVGSYLPINYRQSETNKRALHARMSHNTFCNTTVSTKKTRRILVK